MTQGIDFDASAARALEAAYMTTDVQEQRCVVLRELSPRPGDHVLDVGCGPGLLVRDLAGSVGPEGRVHGLDPSAPMLAVARQRCSDQPWVSFETGDAAALPFPDASLDAVVSTQVYEYVPDIPGALAEIARVLRPGGRVAILDTDYDSLVIHTRDRARLDRILDAWDEHFVHRSLPQTLVPALRDAGFRLRRALSIPIFNADYQPNAFGFHLVKLIAAFSGGRRQATKADARAWLEELDELGREGRFFFSLNRYLFVAERRA
jgi:ubiquinone/menaquinone biosynthesis C-methylase UbiE